MYTFGLMIKKLEIIIHELKFKYKNKEETFKNYQNFYKYNV